MAVIDPTFPEPFYESLARGKFNFASDVFKVALSLNAPDDTTLEVYDDIDEIAALAGYAEGGQTTTPTLQRVGAVVDIFFTDTTFAASGTYPQFRYIYVYDFTHADKPVVCYYDYGSIISMLSGDGFVVDFSAVFGAVRITLGVPPS